MNSGDLTIYVSSLFLEIKYTFYKDHFDLGLRIFFVLHCALVLKLELVEVVVSSIHILVPVEGIITHSS